MRIDEEEKQWLLDQYSLIKEKKCVLSAAKRDTIVKLVEYYGWKQP